MDTGPLSIVTHHWSPNYRKGFDIYKHLDDLLATSKYWEGIIKFTYIGNLPEGFLFKKTKHIQPISGELLGRELSKHHLYLSASINEPAEGIILKGRFVDCPLFMRKWSSPEYCKNWVFLSKMEIIFRNKRNVI